MPPILINPGTPNAAPHRTARRDVDGNAWFSNIYTKDEVDSALASLPAGYSDDDARAALDGANLQSLSVQSLYIGDLSASGSGAFAGDFSAYSLHVQSVTEVSEASIDIIKWGSDNNAAYGGQPLKMMWDVNYSAVRFDDGNGNDLPVYISGTLIGSLIGSIDGSQVVNGGSITGLDGSNISAGTVNIARLPSTVIRSSAGVQTIQPSSGVGALIVKAFNTTGVNLIDFQSNTGSSIAAIGNNGQVRGDSFLLYNGATSRVSMSSTNMLMASNVAWYFKSAGDVNLGSADTGFTRNAAGQIAFLSTPGNFGGFVAGSGSSKLLEVTSTGTKVGDGAEVKKILSSVATLDFGSIAASAQAELTITVTGAAVGDSVHLSTPALLESGIVITARVSSADTVSVRATNVTGSSIDPASGSYRATVFKF